MGDAADRGDYVYEYRKCMNLNTIAKTAPYYRGSVQLGFVWCMRSFDLDTFAGKMGWNCG